jgi:hypothetical protein
MGKPYRTLKPDSSSLIERIVATRISRKSSNVIKSWNDSSTANPPI